MGKKNIRSFFVLALLFFTLPASLFLTYAYYKDPLYLFHAPRGEKIRLEKNMRIQAAGIINSFEFDSVVLGTSVLENTSARHCSKVLGGKFVNLSLSGTSPWERSFVLEYLMEKKKVDKVIYSLDRHYLYRSKSTQGYDPDNWLYLYDGNRFNDIKAYLNKTYIRNILFSESQSPMKDLDRPAAWMYSKNHSCRFGGLRNWVVNKKQQGLENFLLKDVPFSAKNCSPSAIMKRDRKKEAAAIEYVERNLFYHVEKNRDTTFYIVFPPYWRYDSARNRQLKTVDFAIHQEVIRYAVNRAEKLPNAHIYGFEDCSFVDDIANYKDITHYGPKINEYITESMGAGKHRLTGANIEAYLSRCDELAREFDFKALDKDVKKLFAEQASLSKNRKN